MFLLFVVVFCYLRAYICTIQTTEEHKMKLSKVFGKAMVDKEVKGFKQLSDLSGISYERTIRIMKDEPSAKMVDVVAVGECLGLELKFIKKGA